MAIGLGFMRPMLVARYLTAFVPGLLFGLALLGQWLGRSWRFAPGCLAAAFLAASVLWASTANLGENAYNFETASYALMKAQPRYLIFLWDNPSRPDDATIRDVGRFFFSRAGQPITVRPVALSPGQDPIQTLDKTARPPGSAILWLYDRKLIGAGAIGLLRTFRPRDKPGTATISAAADPASSRVYGSGDKRIQPRAPPFWTQASEA